MKAVAIIGGTIAFGPFANADIAKQAAAETFEGQPLTVLNLIEPTTGVGINPAARHRISQIERDASRTPCAHASIEVIDDLRARLSQRVANDPRAYRRLMQSKICSRNTIRNVLSGAHLSARIQTVVALERWLAEDESGNPTPVTTESANHPAVERALMLDISADEFARMLGVTDQDASAILSGGSTKPYENALNTWMECAVLPNGDGTFTVL